MKMPMVLTSRDQLGNTGRKTGFWLEEFVAPYFVFRDGGVELMLASPKGGHPRSIQRAICRRFKLPDDTVQAGYGDTEAVISNSEAFRHEIGGFRHHSSRGRLRPMCDLVDNPDSIALIESFYNSGKPVAAVCHSPGVFHRVMYQCQPLVKGKRVTDFTNGEEAAMNLTHVVPFLVEDDLKRIGAFKRTQLTGPPSR
jgi:putative intracellular protease/amidase